MTHCPYCNKPVKIVDALKVYTNGKNLTGHKVAHCEPCGAWVSCHKSGVPMGTVAKNDLRRARKLLHDHFDPLWREKLFRGKHHLDRRKAAYQWLAEKMDIPVHKTHIGMFNEEQADAALAFVKQFIKEKGCSYRLTTNGIKLMKGETP